MHRRLKPDRGEVLHGHMTRQRRAIHKQRVTAHMTIVPHMRRSQEEIPIANRGLSAAAHRAPADGHVLAKRIPLANFERRFFTLKAKILRIAAHRAKRMKHVVVANLRGAQHHGVRVQHAPFAKLDVLANHRIRPNANACTDFRACRDDRLLVDLRRTHFVDTSTLAGGAGTRSTILHISVASAASWPSTVARPSSLQKSPRQEITFISTRN